MDIGRLRRDLKSVLRACGARHDPFDRRHGRDRVGPAAAPGRRRRRGPLPRARSAAPGPEPGPGPDHAGRPGEPLALRQAVRGVRAVVHLAAAIRDQRDGHDRGAERPRHRAAAALRRVRGSRALRLLRRAGRDPQLAHALLSRQGAGRAGRRGVADRRHRAVPLDRLRARRPVHVAAAPALAAARGCRSRAPGARGTSRCGPRTRPSAPSTRCAAAPPTAPAGSSLPARRS